MFAQHGMTSVGDLLGPLRKLKNIAPPRPNYEDWHRFFRDCEKAGVGAVRVDRDTGQMTEFVTPIGLALLRSYRWITESEQRGIPFQEACTAYYASMERDGAAMKAMVVATQASIRRAQAERDGAPKRVAEELHTIADDLGLPLAN